MKKSDFRINDSSDEYVKRPVKLSPVKKNGKERRVRYDEYDDEDDMEPVQASRHESAYDYYDDIED